MTDPVRERRIDIAICASLALATVVAAGVTAQSLGFTRDEGYYFKAAELYWGWFRELLHSPASALSFASIDRGWSYNHEHPALLKTLFAWSFGLDDALGMPVATHNAMRLPAWCVAGVAVAVTYALARAMLSRRAAVLAALLFVCMPRVFWHMHLSCFDVGVTAAHTALVLAYVRYRHTNKGALVVGIAFGLCAAVKHNVIPVPAILVLHYLLTEMTSTRRIPLAFLSMMFVGPLVYLAHWPWLWPHPFERFGAYVAYHLGHENYPILYFGDLLTHPPFPIAFPFVMSAVTIPVPTLVAMILGVALGTVVAVRFLRARFASAPSSSSPSSSSSSSSTLSLAGGDAILLLLNAAYPFVLIALPSTPKFGGTKHWMNALPFLCVLAAFACEEVARR
ncbi:MAG TPA: glycosyltransferase family 39 protein, partial [Myxococcota bacterium]